jgi:hypothetical protein
MTRTEGEAVDDSEGGRFGMEGACGDDGGVPVLVLEVGFDRPVVTEVEVQACTWGVDDGTGTDIEEAVVEETAVEVVDAAAAYEEVGVGVEAAKLVLDFGAEEEALLAADVAAVYRVGSADFEGGLEVRNSQEGKVGTCGDAAIFASFKVGIGAREAAKGGEPRPPGSSGDGLRVAGVSQGCEGCEQGQLRQGFRLLHSGFQPLSSRVLESWMVRWLFCLIR